MTIILSVIIIILFLVMSRMAMIGHAQLIKKIASLQAGWESNLVPSGSIQNIIARLQEKILHVESQITQYQTTIANQCEQVKQRQTNMESKLIGIQNALTMQERQTQHVYQSIQSLPVILNQCCAELRLQDGSHSELLQQKLASLLESYTHLQTLLPKLLEEQNIPALRASIHSLQTQMQDDSQQNRQAISNLQTTQQQIYSIAQNTLSIFPEKIQTLLEQTVHIRSELQPLLEEVHNWSIEPLVRRRDLQKHKVSVFVDFENFFISLWDKDIEIYDYQRFKSALMDPEGQGLYICERIVFFTNKSRWQRKEFYDKKKNISQKEATLIKENLRNYGCRIIESDSNIDVPLSLLVLKTAQRGDAEEFTLVANDGTYAGLLKELSNIGCQVNGILLGEASGDLVACYKKLGYKRYHIKTKEDFARFGLRHKSTGKISAVPILATQNAATVIPSLLATIRKQRMQFLGPQLQDQVLHAIHDYVQSVNYITRPELLEQLMQQFAEQIQAGMLTKTKLNNVLNILWKSPCFHLKKPDDEASTSICLKPEYVDYNLFRREHDQILMQQALDANLIVAPQIWSEFLYGTTQKTQEISEWIQSHAWQDYSSEDANCNPLGDEHSLEESSWRSYSRLMPNVPTEDETNHDDDEYDDDGSPPDQTTANQNDQHPPSEKQTPTTFTHIEPGPLPKQEELILPKKGSLIATFLQLSKAAQEAQHAANAKNETPPLLSPPNDSLASHPPSPPAPVATSDIPLSNIKPPPESAILNTPTPSPESTESQPIEETPNEANIRQILAAVRKQKMQFLKPKLQDKIFRDIHQFLCQKGRLLRNTLVDELSIYLEPYFQTKELTKTKVSGLVAILRKARSLLIEKEESTGEAFAILAESQRDYAQFRKAHDAVFVAAALKEGIDMSAQDWSLFLYEDSDHSEPLQQIIMEQKQLLTIHNSNNDLDLE